MTLNELENRAKFEIKNPMGEGSEYHNSILNGKQKKVTVTRLQNPMPHWYVMKNINRV